MSQNYTRKQQITLGCCKTSKNVNIQQLPQKMFKNNVHIKDENLPDEFANFFQSKVQNIVNEQPIQNGMYNGTQKIN